MKGVKMAVRYTDINNRFVSGYTVSGQQSEMIKKAILQKSPEESIESIKRTSSSIKMVLAKIASKS